MAATNLPTRQAALIGREDDARAVEDLLAEEGLVSIVGAGGIGKTRLALAVALGQRAAFPDGVWWVDLASINDRDMVPNAIAQAVGITSAAERPTVALLVSVLRRSRSLLVLDNCEHLLEPVAQVVDVLLRECAELRFLITSQEPLKLAGEQTYRLGPLALPREDESVDERTAAVALFVARAQTHDRRLKFDATALGTVGSICRELDGLPLAIELAAARVPLLGLDGLRARLRERFNVLTGGSRIELRRHQTLHAAIEWSHGLLTDDERIVFRRLGVFSGGFSLPLAQPVASDARIDPWTLLELLGHLVDKSLVTTDLRDTAAEPRYRLLESTRAYALEQLAAAGETQQLLRRHAQALQDFLLPLQLRHWTLTDAERRCRCRDRQLESGA
jgi:predicted ATPase